MLFQGTTAVPLTGAKRRPVAILNRGIGIASVYTAGGGTGAGSPVGNCSAVACGTAAIAAAIGR
eukprot:scaffold4298_cov99-Isochrysis_galbana.AAC.4